MEFWFLESDWSDFNLSELCQVDLIGLCQNELLSFSTSKIYISQFKPQCKPKFSLDSDKIRLNT